MSTESLPAERGLQLHDRRVVIVAARYNERYTSALLTNCQEELAKLAPGVQVDVVRVPGAYEVPMMVNRVIARPGAGQSAPDAVIALGVILRGSTAHADLIGSAITQELLRTSCSTLTPVIHEVLLLNNEQQAEERCIQERLNRGIESARAAVAMLQVLAGQDSNN